MLTIKFLNVAYWTGYRIRFIVELRLCTGRNWRLILSPSGFFRVNYTEDNWASLIGQLNASPAAIHVVNRAQLIDDSFNLARAGLLNYSVPLSLTQYLNQEDDVIPWFSAMKHLNYVLDHMAPSDDGYADVLVRKLFGIVIVYWL